MAYRFNPPPGWPLPAGFEPPPNWQPDPSWPPVPPGWPLWLAEDAAPGSGLPAAPAVQYPAQPYQPYQAYGYGAPPPRPGTNGFAITSLILGVIGGSILSIIFGIIGLVQIRNRGQRGRGLAITGITLGCVWLVIGIALIASSLSINAANSSTPNVPPAGVIQHTEQINIFSLVPGDCFQNPPPSQTVLGVTRVTAVPCTVAHNAQAFAQFDAANAAIYPGSQKLINEAQHGCQQRESVLNKSAVNSTMTLRYLFPLLTSWTTGKRTITCLVVSNARNLTSSLLKG